LAAEDIPIVFVIDEDVSMRKGLRRLCVREGWRSETFADAKEFLACRPATVPSCLVLNASQPGIDALELQRRITADRPGTTIIFTAGRADVAMTVKAIKAGAIEFLMKPFQEDDLLTSIREALDRSRVKLAYEAEMQPLRDNYLVLSRREREVMLLVVAGLLNKQVAAELGISEITVKAHRGQVMGKMRANSFADLVKMAGKLHLSSAA
jgi:FixJ family two-component response regulator